MNAPADDAEALEIIRALTLHHLPAGTTIERLEPCESGRIIHLVARFPSGEELWAPFVPEVATPGAAASALLTSWRLMVDEDVRAEIYEDGTVDPDNAAWFAGSVARLS